MSSSAANRDASTDRTQAAQEFLLQAWHNRRIALTCFLAMLMVVLAIAAVVPAHYKASATLAVLPAPEFTVRPNAGSRDQTASALALDQIMKAETAILESDDLHLATLRQVGEQAVYPDPRQSAGPSRSGALQLIRTTVHRLKSIWIASPPDVDAAGIERELAAFRHDLLVLPAKDSNIIAVSFFNRDPNVASAVVNTMLTLYAARRRDLYDDPQLQIIRRETEVLRAAAIRHDLRLSKYKRDNAIFDFEAQRLLLLNRRNSAEVVQSDAATDMAGEKARIETLTMQLKNEPLVVNAFKERDPDTRIQLAASALHDLSARVAAASERYRPGSRMLSHMRSELAVRTSELRKLQTNQSPSVVRDERSAAVDVLRLDRFKAGATLEAIRARQRSAHGLAYELDASLATLLSLEPELVALDREKKNADDSLRTASLLVSERHLIEAEDASRLANVRVIQAARVPQSASPLPFYIIVAGFLLDSLATFGLLVGLFLSRGVFLSSAALSEALGLPVLASYGFQAGSNRDTLLPA